MGDKIIDVHKWIANFYFSPLLWKWLPRTIFSTLYNIHQIRWYIIDCKWHIAIMIVFNISDVRSYLKLYAFLWKLYLFHRWNWIELTLTNYISWDFHCVFFFHGTEIAHSVGLSYLFQAEIKMSRCINKYHLYIC